MASEILPTSRFSEWFVSLGVDSPTRVDYRFSVIGGGDHGGASSSGDDGIAGFVVEDLAVLRTIYATHGFIPDADGNALAPTFHGDSSITSIDDLEPNGYWNFLDANSWSRLQNGKRVNSDSRHTVRVENSDGSVDHQVVHGVSQKPYTPDGNDQPISLAGWTVNPANDSRLFAVVYEFTKAEGVTDSALQSKLPILGMNAFLRARHQSGAAPGAGGLTTANLNGRVFRIPVGNVNYDFTFGSASPVYFYNTDGTASDEIQWFYFFGTYDAGLNDFDNLALQDVIRATIQAIGVQQNSLYRAIGSIDAPLRGSRIEGPDRAHITFWDKHVRLHDDETGLDMPITANNSVIQTVNELVPITTIEGIDAADIPANSFWLPSDQITGHIHYTGQPANHVTLYVPRPDRATPRNNDYHQKVRNIDPGATELKVNVRNSWTNGLLASLAKQQHVDLFISHEKTGAGEVVADLEDRILITHQAVGNWDYEDMTMIGTWHRRRIVPLGDETRLSVESFVKDAQGITGLFQVLASGFMKITVTGEIGLLNNPGAGNWEVMDMRLRGRSQMRGTEPLITYFNGFDIVNGTTQRLGGTTGAYNNHSFTYERIVPVQQGFYYALELNEVQEDVPVAQIEVRNWNLSFELDSTIVHRFTP